MESTKLRKLYETLGILSTKPHVAICEDLTRGLRAQDAAGSTKNLAALFQSALEENEKVSEIGCNFLDEDLLRERAEVSANSTGGNKVAYYLQKAKELEPESGPKFKFVEREFPHLRAENMEQQREKAWIDYVGIADDETPVLGEVKVGTDKNPFYALIQLLMYLSEIGTENQRNRIKRWQAFGDIGTPSQFDLQILLVGFEENEGRRFRLLELTRDLASRFLEILKKRDEETAKLIRSIQCLKGTLSENAIKLESYWRVEN